MRIHEIDSKTKAAGQQNFDIAYHITLEQDADYTTKVGLKTSEGRIYLIVDKGNLRELGDEILTVLRWMEAKTENSDEPLNILQINIQGIPLAESNGWYVATTDIPADRIKNLGPVADQLALKFIKQGRAQNR